MQFFPRRRTLIALLLVMLPLVTGCDKLSFMPQARKKAATGYDAVKTGMNEQQVVRALGEPTRRTGIDLEGTGTRARLMTYVSANSLITITLVGGAVVGKQKY